LGEKTLIRIGMIPRFPMSPGIMTLPLAEIPQSAVTKCEPEDSLNAGVWENDSGATFAFPILMLQTQFHQS
jgi:hypothetical protein